VGGGCFQNERKKPKNFYRSKLGLLRTKIETRVAPDKKIEIELGWLRTKKTRVAPDKKKTRVAPDKN